MQKLSYNLRISFLAFSDQINLDLTDINTDFYKWYILLLFFGVFSTVNSQPIQTDSTLIDQDIKTILVNATKVQKSWVPAATSIYTISPKAKDQLVQNSLQEFLLQSPSIFALNANNKAQDLRISIRGFGSRAAFGVRGVKVIVDGIPETTTDGQGQLDNLNLGIIDRIEILNSGSSAIYGNASGGVINIMTTNESVFSNKNHFLETGIGAHSYGGQQYQLTTGKQFNNTSLIFHANHHQGNGYREHSEFQSTNFNLRASQKITASSKLEAILNYMNSPTANDPGGVNQVSFDSIPTAARDRNIQFDAGEAIDQFKGSLRFESDLNEGLKLNTYGFYSNRNFYGRLPFGFGGVIDLKRNFLGHGTSLSFKPKSKNIKWTSLWGYELSAQRDVRERFMNEDGVQGEATLSQNEQFSNLGCYGINDFNFDKLTFNLALRYDVNKIEVVDKLPGNSDDSGIINLNDFNYSLGVSYQFANWKSLFLSYSTSFETPTLNELSNNPDGSGFNPNLKAQSANHLEFGLKGYIQEKSTFQLSVFQIASKNELLPYELEAFPGRTFFRNVGSTNRLGLEFFIKHPFNEYFSANTNWSFNRFTFGDYELDGENFEDNILPGLPDFQGFVQFDIRLLKYLEINYQNQILGKIFTNDSNSVYQKPKFISNISLKYNVEKEKFSVHPYLGINNIFQAKYADNIRINAFGSRFFEAAPKLLVFGGIRVLI